MFKKYFLDTKKMTVTDILLLLTTLTPSMRNVKILFTFWKYMVYYVLLGA